MSKQNDTITALLTKQVAVPKGANVIRLPGPRPSAVANPFLKPVLNWSTPPALAQQLLPADEAIVIVTNDPLCAMIFTNKNPNALLLSYTWLFSGVGNSAVFTVAPGQTPDLSDDLCWAIPTAGTPFHGPRLYARNYKGKKWMWCDASTTVSATNVLAISTNTIPMAATDAITITVYRLNEGDELQETSVRVPGPFAASTTIFQFAFLAADYYRVVVVGDDDNTTAVLNFAINHNAQSEIMVHLALPDLTERQAQLVQAIRVLGASSHAMNLVSDQNATGSWVGDQPSQGVIWTTYIRGVSGSNGFQRLTGQQGNELMELKKYNPYTFVTPEDNADWEYTIPFNFDSSGTVTNTLHKELDKFHYTITYLKSGGTTLATADPSRNVQLEFFFALEYTTDGLWPMLGTSPASEDDKSAAIKVLASLENITHNPGFNEIMKTIGKYVRLAPPVLAMLGPYGKGAALIAAGTGAILGRMGYRTKKTARQERDEEGQHKAPRLAQTADMGD